MSKRQYELLKDELNDIVDIAEKYPHHIQAAIVDNLCAALISGSSGKAYDSVIVGQSPRYSASESLVDEDEVGEWDSRRKMLSVAKLHGLDLRTMNDQLFTTFVAYIVRVFGPEEHNLDPITESVLIEACRTARHRLPTNPSSTLSKARQTGMLDKAKGKPGYILAPKGENRINELLDQHDIS